MGRPAHDAALAKRLNARPVRIGLSLMLAVSMLPFAPITSMWWVFAGVFGAELLLRLLAGRPPEERWWRLFVLVDVLALLSFLPLESWVGPEVASTMVTLRLMRLAMLMRFAQGLTLDVWRILTRREQLAQFGLVTVAVTALAFAAAVVLTELGVPHNYDGPDTFWSKFWWAFRQLESADNLVSPLPPEPLILLISLGLTLIGVFIVSFIIGIGTNVVEQVVLLERKRRITWSGHTLIIGPIAHAEVLVREYVSIHAKNRSHLRPADLWRKLVRRGPLPQLHGRAPIALLGPDEHAPAFLYEPGMRAVVYRAGSGSNAEDLGRVGVDGVKRAIIVANTAADADVDAVSIAGLAAFRRQNTEAHVFVEVRDRKNVGLVRDVGGHNTFPMHLPRYVGLFLCHQIVVPGVDRLYAELLTARGAELYSHVFVDESDAAVIDALNAAGDHVAFSALGESLLARTGCTLIGLMVGKTAPARAPNGLLSLGGTQIHLNPLVNDDPADGTTIGAPVATHHLRGVVALAPSYLELRDAVRDAWSTAPAATRVARGDETPLDSVPAQYGHVLIVGYSPALGPLIDALPAFAPGIRITAVLSARRGANELRKRLGELHEDLGGHELPGSFGRCAMLGRGAKLTVYTHDESDLATFALHRLEATDPPDAAVFLSDPDSFDRDARTLLRLVRFGAAYKERHGQAMCHLASTGELHVVAEFSRAEQAELAKSHCTAMACGLSSDSFRLTIVSTEHIRNYFMVHSAFVPGIGNVYDQLLGKDEFDQLSGRRSPEIVRVDLRGKLAHGPIDWVTLWRRLTASRLVPIAVEVTRADWSVEIVTSGTAGEAPDGARVTAAFAVGVLRPCSATRELIGHPVGE